MDAVGTTRHVATRRVKDLRLVAVLVAQRDRDDAPVPTALHNHHTARDHRQREAHKDPRGRTTVWTPRASAILTAASVHVRRTDHSARIV